MNFFGFFFGVGVGGGFFFCVGFFFFLWVFFLCGFLFIFGGGGTCNFHELLVPWASDNVS